MAAKKTISAGPKAVAGVSTGDLIKWGAVGGVITGALSIIPLVNCCAMHVLLGGFVGGFLLKGGKKIELVSGAIVGVVSGLIGALLASIAGIIFGILGTAMQAILAGDMTAAIATVGAGLFGTLVTAVISAMVNFVVYPIIGAIGGAVASQL